MPDFFGRLGDCPIVISVAGIYQPGDQPPSGYLDWTEWAEVQHKAGLRQVTCPHCSLWKFPQELSHVTHRSEVEDGKGNVFVVTARVCNDCLVKVRAARAADVPDAN